MSEDVKSLMNKINALRRQCANVSTHLNSLTTSTASTSSQGVSTLLHAINGQLNRAYLSAIKLYKKLMEMETVENLSEAVE